MFRQMLIASRAVLRNPSVATFEAHERNDIVWATLYMALSALISGVCGAIAAALHRPFIAAQYGELLRDVDQALPAADQNTISALLVPGDPVTAVITNLVGTLIGYFIFLGCVYLLGYLFGGRGKFGELAYDVALYWAPLSVLSSLINILSVGLLSLVAVPLGLAVGIYQLYLTYLSIRSGLDLSVGRALAVILLPIVVLLVLFCVLVGLIAAVD